MLGLVFLLLLASFARAHEGPPYPVVVDESRGPYMITVWADPDVGVGTFWIELDETSTQRAPEDTRVHVAVAPADGRAPFTRVLARREERSSGQRHFAEVDFPTREFWTVVVELSSESTGAHAESRVTVEVTPPGYGPIDLLLYSWPFAALGWLWIRALRRQRAHDRSESAAAAR